MLAFEKTSLAARAAGCVPTACALLMLVSCASTARRAAPTLRTYDVHGPAASHYRSEPPEGEGLRGPHAYRVTQAIDRITQGGSQLEPDARLADVAAQVAASITQHGVIPEGAAIDLWAQHAGVFEPTPAVAVLHQPSAEQLAALIERELSQALADQPFTHVGAVTLEHGGAPMVVLVMSSRRAKLAPIARAVAQGAVISVRGQLDRALADPELIVAYPDGSAFRKKSGASRTFAFDAPSKGRGAHRVELLASSRVGPTVVANVPVYVGVPPSTSVTVAADAEPGSQSVSEMRERLLELINAERARIGLGALKAHQALADVALAHSRDMRDAGFVGHTSPTTGSASDRVERAGLRVALVLENVGRGYGAEGVHRGLVDSPGHRANIVSPDATHVGIGVVEVMEGEGRAYLVTQLFTRVPEQLDQDEARARVRAAIAKNRSRASAPELRTDDKLDALCQDAASSFFDAGAPPDERAVLQALNRRAAGSRLPYTRVSALLVLVSAPEQAAEVEALLDPKAKAIGLGLAQGSRKDTIDDAIAVVALLAY